ncbi:hypothetical protein RB195_022570 [Necator americanus]|uniref:Uncharacterized protein n=1 Tax=Necator americanus TaxID=51031 RepID=A0ABR1EFU2_NECAM
MLLYAPQAARLLLPSSEIQLKTDASTCFVEFGQHSFRLADAKCYQQSANGVAADPQPSLPCRPIPTFALRSRE